MRTLVDKHFDLAIVDPPYFEGPNKSDITAKDIQALVCNVPNIIASVNLVGT